MSTTVQVKNSTKHIQLICVTGLFAAMIYVLTAWLHIPTGAGYTHAGDGLIYLAASMLPTPYAMAAGAIGAGLADGLSGFVVWLPGTIVIKAITVLCFSRNTEKIICVRNLLGIIPALVICVVCYSLYEGIFMAGGFSKSAIISAFGQTPAYCIQVLASSILYIVLGLGFDKAGLKKKFSHLFG